MVMTMKVKIKREKDRSQPKRLNLEELKDEKAKQYAVEVTDRFDALEAVMLTRT